MLFKGITKLSELNIDADKDWAAHGITNIKQIAASMDIGSLAQHNGVILQRFAPGPQGYVVTSAGPGKLLTWAPAGGALKYYLPVYVTISVSTLKNSLAHTGQRSPSITSHPAMTTVDDPTDLIRIRQPAVALAAQTQKQSLAHDQPLTKAAGSHIYVIVDGAVSETGAGAQSNETAAAQNSTANDMNLPPMTPAAGDKYYFGFRYPFRGIWLQQGTAGVGNWQTNWYYWNGAWIQLNETDLTSQFMNSGFCRVWWGTKPADWIQGTILSLTWYWVKVQVTSYSNQTSKPLGTQAWCIL